MPWLLDLPVFFIDRCLGNSDVPAALRKAGMQVEIHDNHFTQDCKDEIWLKEVGRRHWVILTKDQRIRYRAIEKEALLRSGAAAFILSGRDMSGTRIAESFIRALPKILRKLESYARPLVAVVTPAGEVVVRIGERRGGKRK